MAPPKLSALHHTPRPWFSDEVISRPLPPSICFSNSLISQGILVRAAITKYHRLGGLNIRHLFLMVLEAGSPRSGCRCVRGSGEAVFSTVLMAEQARELSGGLFTRALIPFMRAPPSGPRHLPKAPPPNTITVGVRTSTYECWDHRHSVHSTTHLLSGLTHPHSIRFYCSEPPLSPDPDTSMPSHGPSSSGSHSFL